MIVVKLLLYFTTNFEGANRPVKLTVNSSNRCEEKKLRFSQMLIVAWRITDICGKIIFGMVRMHIVNYFSHITLSSQF